MIWFLSIQKNFIDKVYLHSKDPYHAKYELLINKRKCASLKHCSDFQAVIEYLNDMDDIEEYNPNKEHKILIVFDDMITDTVSNKNLNAIVTELFIRVIKLNISVVFVTESYSAVPKNVRRFYYENPTQRRASMHCI